jgi:hypothetical protein
MNFEKQLNDHKNPQVEVFSPAIAARARERALAAAPRAVLPNHFQVVKDTYNAGHYDLSTNLGCGAVFLEDVTAALAKVDPGYGDLLKNPGQNQRNGHAVDNPLYLPSGQAIDLVAKSESVWAAPQWAPDIPRYGAANWKKRTTGAAYVMPPVGNFKLGHAMFWYGAGFKDHRDTKFRPFAKRASEKYKVKYVRGGFTLGGDLFQAPDGTRQDPWGIAGSFFNEPGHKQNHIDAINCLYNEYGLQMALELVMSGAQAQHQSERNAICDRACEVVEKCGPEKFFMIVMWNEYWMTHGSIPWIQDMVKRVYNRLGHQIPLAMDTPASILETPTSEQDYERIQAQIRAEMHQWYPAGFVAANACPPQYNRDLPNPLKREIESLAPNCNFWVDHEHRGVGTSGQSVDDDPLPIVNDICQMIETGHRGKTLTFLPGIWGGLCYYWTDQNRWPTLESIPNHEMHEWAVSEVMAGRYPRVPKPGTSVPPNGGGEEVIPYDEGKSIEFGVACNEAYAQTATTENPAGMPKDPGLISVHSQRAAWDYYSGKLPWDESKKVHVNDLRKDIGLPPL